jgi:hypothetical protein
LRIVALRHSVRLEARVVRHLDMLGVKGDKLRLVVGVEVELQFRGRIPPLVLILTDLSRVLSEKACKLLRLPATRCLYVAIPLGALPAWLPVLPCILHVGLSTVAAACGAATYPSHTYRR